VILVIGAGEIGCLERLTRKWASVRGVKRVIAVDGGYRACRRLGIRPDLLIGDFDSLPRSDFEHAVRAGTAFHSFPSDKDESDLRLALQVTRQWSKDLACGISLAGVTGGREDHHQAALFDITDFASRSRSAWQIWGARSEWHFCNRHVPVSVPVVRDQLVSIFSMKGAVRGLQTKGLKWDGGQVKLLQPGSRGLSNVATHSRVRVSIQSGCAAVVLPLAPR